MDRASSGEENWLISMATLERLGVVAKLCRRSPVGGVATAGGTAGDAIAGDPVGATGDCAVIPAAGALPLLCTAVP